MPIKGGLLFIAIIAIFCFLLSIILSILFFVKPIVFSFIVIYLTLSFVLMLMLIVISIMDFHEDLVDALQEICFLSGCYYAVLEFHFITLKLRSRPQLHVFSSI
jgi:hypothetical protein